MKYKVGDVVSYNNADVMLYGHCEYLIVDIDYNWGCPNYIVRMRQGRNLSEKRYKVRTSWLDAFSELVERGTTYKEENQMNIEHKKKPETKIKTNLEMIREMDSERLAQFLTLHGYQLEPDSKPLTAEVEKWLNNYIIDPESACAVLNKLITDDPAVVSKSDMTAVVSLAIKYIEGAEALKKEVAEISGVSAKAAKMIQDLVAQYLP